LKAKTSNGKTSLVGTLLISPTGTRVGNAYHKIS